MLYLINASHSIHEHMLKLYTLGQREILCRMQPLEANPRACRVLLQTINQNVIYSRAMRHASGPQGSCWGTSSLQDHAHS